MIRRAALIALITLSVGLTPAVAAHLAHSSAYAGRTSDRHGISFRLSRNLISGFSFQTRFHCGKLGTFVAHASYGGIRVRGGHFKASFATRDHSIQTAIRGSIRGRRASGTIRRTARFDSRRKLDPRGTLVCRSNVSWSVRRRGR